MVLWEKWVMLFDTIHTSYFSSLLCCMDTNSREHEYFVCTCARTHVILIVHTYPSNCHPWHFNIQNTHFFYYPFFALWYLYQNCTVGLQSHIRTYQGQQVLSKSFNMHGNRLYNLWEYNYLFYHFIEDLALILSYLILSNLILSNLI